MKRKISMMGTKKMVCRGELRKKRLGDSGRVWGQKGEGIRRESTSSGREGTKPGILRTAGERREEKNT